MADAREGPQSFIDNTRVNTKMWGVIIKVVVSLNLLGYCKDGQQAGIKIIKKMQMIENQKPTEAFYWKRLCEH